MGYIVAAVFFCVTDCLTDQCCQVEAKQMKKKVSSDDNRRQISNYIFQYLVRQGKIYLCFLQIDTTRYSNMDIRNCTSGPDMKEWGYDLTPNRKRNQIFDQLLNTLRSVAPQLRSQLVSWWFGWQKCHKRGIYYLWWKRLAARFFVCTTK